VDHNPYTPPNSEVGTGFVDGPPPRRTVSVWIALFLVGLYILQLMYSIKLLRRFYAGGAVSEFFVFWSGVRVVLAIAAFFAIAFGRRWGRILLVLITLQASFAAISGAWRVFSNVPELPWASLAGFLALLPWLMCVVAIYLLFGAGRHWFEKRAAPG